MDVTTLLWTSFVSLVGLQLCVPDGSVEKMADSIDISGSLQAKRLVGFLIIIIAILSFLIQL